MFEPNVDLQSKDNITEPRPNRQRLRSATQKMHTLSEQRWADIFAQPHGLRQFLIAMRGLHVSFGLPSARRIDPQDGLDTEQRRVDALNADLQNAAFTAQIPTVAIGQDEAWGMLYALNGSALGATSLLAPGAALAEQPSAYLMLMRDYARSGALGAFIRALNAQTLDMPRATAGADAVFAAMSQQNFNGKIMS